MNRPWFAFYVQDWGDDPDLQRCSLAARGLWIEMLRLMHRGKPYGHLHMDGSEPILEYDCQGNVRTMSGLCQLVRASDIELTETLRCLKVNNVFSVNDKGIVYSRRMVRDESKRKKDRKYQKKHRDAGKSVRPLSGECQSNVRPLSAGSSESESDLTFPPPKTPEETLFQSFKSNSSDDSIKNTPEGSASWRAGTVTWELYCSGVSWDKKRAEVLLTSVSGSALREHLESVAKEESLEMMTDAQMMQSWGSLNTHLITERYKRGKKTLPGLVRGWCERDMRRFDSYRKKAKGGKNSQMAEIDDLIEKTEREEEEDGKD